MPSLSVQGKWKGSSTWNTILDPLNGEPFIKVAEVDETGVQVCVMSSLQVPYCFIFKTIFPVFYCTGNDLAELRSLCFIMPSFPSFSHKFNNFNFEMVTDVCIFASKPIFPPQLWIDYAAICGELVQVSQTWCTQSL